MPHFLQLLRALAAALLSRLDLDGSKARRRCLKQRAALAMLQTTGHRLVRASHIQQLRGQA